MTIEEFDEIPSNEMEKLGWSNDDLLDFIESNSDVLCDMVIYDGLKLQIRARKLKRIMNYVKS